MTGAGSPLLFFLGLLLWWLCPSLLQTSESLAWNRSRGPHVKCAFARGVDHTADPLGGGGPFQQVAPDPTTLLSH